VGDEEVVRCKKIGGTGGGKKVNSEYKSWEILDGESE
jgi:hypothetical protein